MSEARGAAKGERVAVITGDAGGIGTACVALFHQLGWSVVSVDRAESGPVADLRVRADVAVEADQERAFSQIGERFNRIDALVNNAAEQICKSAPDTSAGEWD